MKSTKLQIPVLPSTRDLLNQIAILKNVPLNRLIVAADPEVMNLLRIDLLTRTNISEKGIEDKKYFSRNSHVSNRLQPFPALINSTR